MGRCWIVQICGTIIPPVLKGVTDFMNHVISTTQKIRI
jgi:hypothetical protein